MTASRKYIGGLVAAFLLASTLARAESGTRPQANLYQWLVKAGPIAFNSAGGAFLPLSVLNGVRNGDVSPILLFVLANNLMAKCTDAVVRMPPDIRDPYVVAKAKFEYGLCRIKKCFQQGMLIVLLPQLSSKNDEQDQNAGKQQGLLLAQAFKKDPACDGKGGDGMDPMLLTLFSGQR